MRIATLENRLARLREVPQLDDGLLRFHGRWIALTDVEVRIIGILLEHFGTVVALERIATRSGPDGARGTDVVRLAISRLRRRLATLDLQLSNIRTRGYILHSGRPNPDPPRS